MELFKGLWEIEMMRWRLALEYWYVWAIPMVIAGILIIVLLRKGAI